MEGVKEPDDIFGGPVSSYSRRQAIEDGVLVQLSGPGYQGDPWIPAMVKEAGFRDPLAMTSGAFFKCVMPEGGKLPAGQDPKGRLWDVLWMLKCAIKKMRGGNSVYFGVHVRNDERERTPPLVKLWATCGPGDDDAAAVTIMLEGED